jgi:alpha-beta hydrolase superfamily lysophospholipase
MRTPVVLLLLSACARDAVGPVPLWNPAGSSVFDAPFPTDARLRANGTPDLTGFPNPNDNPLLDTIIAMAQEGEGWSPSGPYYFQFDAPIDVSLLKAPRDSLAPDAPIVLVDVDPTSPEWGRRVPVQWQFDEVSSSWRPGNLLAIAPVYGFPLRPSTRYAVIIRTTLAAENHDFQRALREDPGYAQLRDALFFLGLEADDVAVASVFTTSDPTAEMRVMSGFVRNNIEVSDLSQPVKELDSNIFYKVFEGHYVSPVFTAGVRPYSEEGGGFEFRDDGNPIIQSWDRMRLAVCTPRNLDVTPPPEGWPVVIQQHGTGGDYTSHCSSHDALEIASQLGKAGFISLGIDQPLHGTRVGPTASSDLDHFNFINPTSGRTNFRQGALDAIYLAHSLAAAPTTFTLPDGKTITTDPSRVYFFGHSQGGLTGSLALPFFGTDVKAAVLSGAGAGMSITLVERKDPIDLAQAIEAVAGFDDGETLTELHPVTGLIQQLVDITDPLHYARYIYAEQGDWDWQAPIPVFHTSGLLDAETPHEAAEALAIAGQWPQLVPTDNDPDGFTLRGLTPVEGPVEDDTTAWDGTPITSAVAQFPDDDHFVVFTNRDAAALYRDFLRSAADGAPIIDPDER